MEIAVRSAGSASTEADRESRRRCELALELLLTHRGNPSAVVDRMLSDDPQCVFAHCLRAALVVCANAAAARSSLATSAAAIEAACPDMRHPARRHAAAARAWLGGGASLAIEHYGAIVVDWPRDILALVVSHALDFRLGRRQMLRDRIAQVLPEWEAAMPGYASVLAMYAFGLEENGHYCHAEKMARRALAIDSRHPGAIHVIAHVMEMQGRFREGLAFLAATEPAWVEDTGFSIHLAWHGALFHLDADDPESALAVYDAQIAKESASSMSVLADASSLLWRLKLRNIHVGARWRSLADRWEMQTLVGMQPFYIVHAMMAFAATGRTDVATRLYDGLPFTETSGTLSSLPENALAPPFCEALLAFARSDYAACVEWLAQVRHIAHRCGGSLAQCDLIHLTFTEAALRMQNARLARALVAERAAQKPTSSLNRLLLQRLRKLPSANA